MKQGVLVPHRVRLLLSGKTTCYRSRRTGERKRKSVRGCIVAPDLSVLDLVIVKKGEGELPGLTDKSIPRRLGPKRASKIRKLFNLSKEDDVRKYVIRREIPEHEGKDGKKIKKRTKAPRIQRLVTPVVLQRKRHRIALKRRVKDKAKKEAADYAKLLAKRSREKREAIISRRRSSHRVSEKRDETKGEEHKVAAKGAKDTKAPVKAGKAGAKAPAKHAKDAKVPSKEVKGKSDKPSKDVKPAKAHAKVASKEGKAKSDKPASKDAKPSKSASPAKSAAPKAPVKAAPRAAKPAAPAKSPAPAKVAKKVPAPKK